MNIFRNLFIGALLVGTAHASDISWHPKRVILSQDWVGQGSRVDGMALSGESCYTYTESTAMAALMVRNANARKKTCPGCLHQYRYAEAQVVDDQGRRMNAVNICWTIVTENGEDEVQVIMDADGKLLINNFSMQYFKQSPITRGELFPGMLPRR